MTDLNESTISESRDRKNALRENILVAWHRLTTTVKIYQSNNQVLIDCAAGFLESLIRVIKEEGDLTIQISRGQFYLYDEKLVFQRENVNLIKKMLDYFEIRMIHGYCFTSSIRDATIEQILFFIRILNQSESEKESVSWLRQMLIEKEISWVEVMGSKDKSSDDCDEEMKAMARKTYSYAISSVKEISRKISTQGRSGIRKLKRIVQNMVDFLSEDESILLGMSTVREYDDYTYIHSVNVAILSLCLGKKIGLSRLSLSWLGISAMVHDLGKLDIPQEILNKPGKLTEVEFRRMEQHPLKSVSQVLKLQAARDLKIRILLPPLEHHMKYNASGYPRVRRKQPISLFGRIIGIADVFDALSSSRVYRPEALSPGKVLSMMVKKAGQDFDPILLKVFIGMLGVYPVGTLLHLDTGEMGLVVSAADDDNKTRPFVVLLISDNQGGYKKGKKVNLAKKNPETGGFLKNIVSSSHPSSYGIQPVEFI